MGELIGTATPGKDGLMSKYSAANWVIAMSTDADSSRIYRVCKLSSINIIELFGRYNGRSDEQYCFFRVFVFDNKVVAKLVSGADVCYHFYKDDTYLYVESSGSNYIRSVTRNMTLSLDNVFSNVTNSISLSSLTEILKS